MNDDQNERQPSKVSNEIISLDIYKQYDITAYCKGILLVIHYLIDKILSDDLYWDKIQPIFVDNKGNVILFEYEESNFLLNGINHWDEFLKNLTDKRFIPSEIGIFKFGEGTMVAKFEDKILIMKYNENKLTSSQLIKHKAVDIKGQCDLEGLIIPKNPKYLIIIYKLSEAITFIVWDTETNMEHTNFLGRKEDEFLDYIVGKNSELGFLLFNNYIVDFDLGVPIPFMVAKEVTVERFWAQGMRINKSEDVILGSGTIISPLCYKDIYYNKNKTIDNLDVQKVVSVTY